MSDGNFDMLWKWFDKRGAIDRYDYSEGKSSDDFKAMLNDHECDLISEIERQKGRVAAQKEENIALNKEVLSLRSQLGKERHDVFAQCEALVCARILDWTAAVEGGVHESFATTVLEEFEDFLKSIRDARASGSNPVSKDASMEGRGVDPMLARYPKTDERGK